jgi:hypothetical protein
VCNSRLGSDSKARPVVVLTSHCSPIPLLLALSSTQTLSAYCTESFLQAAQGCSRLRLRSALENVAMSDVIQRSGSSAGGPCRASPH